MSNYSSMKLEFLALKWALTEKLPAWTKMRGVHGQ